MPEASLAERGVTFQRFVHHLVGPQIGVTSVENRVETSCSGGGRTKQSWDNEERLSEQLIASAGGLDACNASSIEEA